MVCSSARLGSSIQATLIASILLFSTFLSYSQEAVDNEAAMRRLSLVSDLQSLLARARQLDKPLEQALAEAEIADGAWEYNNGLARDLLREAYEMTFPEEAERTKLRKIPVGAQTKVPGPLDRARQAVRRRVIQVASRDKKFAGELVLLGSTQMGAFEAHAEYASLAREALMQGDNDAASRYILQSIDADPTQMGVLSAIEQLAVRDRTEADRVILQYIQALSAAPLSFRDGSATRTTIVLGRLIFPSDTSAGSQIQAPGPAVMKAYVAYVLNSRALLEQQFPGSITAARILLMHIYPLLKQYAPELMPQFLDLEQRSRKPGESFSLPTAKSIDDEYKAKFDKQVEKEFESDQPDEIMIQRVISRGDFSKARKLIDKLADGLRKTELLETLNAQQAISLANKGDIQGAQKLAESLVKAASILRVFPVIAGKCAAKNDVACARDSVNQAVKQLKKADVTPFTPPPGVPASFFGTKRDFDPALTSLGSLASAVMSLKDELGLDVLDELVIAANHSELDTGQGRTGFETSLFKKLAAKNEERTTAAALQLQDPLRQIVALAAIDQWKSDKLVAEAKLRSGKNEGPPIKKN